MRASSKLNSVGSPSGALAKLQTLTMSGWMSPDELFLIAQRGHPGAAALGGPREIVAEEQPDLAAVGAAHLPDPHVGMPDRHVARGAKLKPNSRCAV